MKASWKSRHPSMPFPSPPSNIALFKRSQARYGKASLEWQSTLYAAWDSLRRSIPLFIKAHSFLKNAISELNSCLSSCCFSLSGSYEAGSMSSCCSIQTVYSLIKVYNLSISVASSLSSAYRQGTPGISRGIILG